MFTNQVMFREKERKRMEDEGVTDIEALKMTECDDLIAIVCFPRSDLLIKADVYCS